MHNFSVRIVRVLGVSTYKQKVYMYRLPWYKKLPALKLPLSPATKTKSRSGYPSLICSPTVRNLLRPSEPKSQVSPRRDPPAMSGSFGFSAYDDFLQTQPSAARRPRRASCSRRRRSRSRSPRRRRPTPSWTRPSRASRAPTPLRPIPGQLDVLFRPIKRRG